MKSIDLIKDYLGKRGYKFQSVVLGRSPYSRFTEVTTPAGRTMMMSESRLSYPFRLATAGLIMNDKIKSHDFAEFIELPTPDTAFVSLKDKNLNTVITEMLKKHGKVIVKPSNGFQSRGLSINLVTPYAVVKAVELASTVGPVAMIQKQCYGEELRMIAINGKVRSILLRQKPQVIGDGESTLAQLIDKENLLRSQITHSMVTYPKLDKTLIDEALLTDNRVPAKKEIVELGKSGMIRGGASVYDVIKDVHPSYIKAAEQAAEKLSRGIMCVDIMAEDYKAPANDNNFVLIEFNTSMSVPMCYSCRDGKHFKILEEYIGPMLEEALA